MVNPAEWEVFWRWVAMFRRRMIYYTAAWLVAVILALMWVGIISNTVFIGRKL